ncbi:hypothetical protein V5O48_011392 [Marasmius crinis-equi]|uniref:Uncharacterized protein n=1 Tax=Marasmius crinis-equi TaxID=585013 RepID=A0ABR3F5R0_9AGAR
MYTTSSAFLKVLSNAGITHAFVNWGSDHPALLEDLQRQRVEGKETSPQIVTCPNEMVALSAAQGYAQVTGKPAAVIVHVDVGTQALAGAVHNVDRGRTPVLIYAGASASTSRSELKGTRNEWIMWIQDIPDQAAIVRQYMRYTAQINTGRNIDQVVNRALQIGTSDPQGPVYLWARRETMEEELPSSLFNSLTSSSAPPLPISPTGLSPATTSHLATTLTSSHHPLIITSNLGRNPAAITPLIALSGLLSIPIFSTCPSAVNVPFSHPYFVGITYLNPGPQTDALKSHLSKADVVLVLDSDLPWLPMHCAPPDDAKVFILDAGDPLKVTSGVGIWEMGLHPGIQLLSRADAKTALEQVLEATHLLLNDPDSSASVAERIKTRGESLKAHKAKWVASLDSAEAGVGGGAVTVPHIMHTLRTLTQSLHLRTLLINESISNYGLVWEHMRAETPGSVLTSGGSSLGYALGAAAGAFIGEGVLSGGGQGKGGEGREKEREGHGAERTKHDLIVSIVGDGSYMFGVPSSAFWVARRYGTPFLTIILNNGGWKSPKFSMLGVHPEGHGSRAQSGEELSVGFRFPSSSSSSSPNTASPSSLPTSTETFGEDPDYAQIAVAATGGWVWGRRVGSRAGKAGEKGKKGGEGGEELRRVLEEAVRVVVEERRCAVVDVVLDLI